MLPLVLFIVIDPDEILIQNLGSKKFIVREKSQEELLRTMNPKLYNALTVYRTSDVEILRRIEFITERYKQKLLSRYAINLKGYAGYPFISSLPESYQWENSTKDQIVKLYIKKARLSGFPADGWPNWSNFRKATELWMAFRMEKGSIEILGKSRSEKEFQDAMEKFMQELQRDFDAMVEGDDAYWNSVKEINPLRQGKSKKPQ